VGDDKNRAAYAYSNHDALNDSFTLVVQRIGDFIKNEEMLIG